MFLFFFFNDTATTEIYTLSLHDALPILPARRYDWTRKLRREKPSLWSQFQATDEERSEEHTSELQSPCNLVCRLLLEKKKKFSRAPYHRLQAQLHYGSHAHRETPVAYSV